ncbi:MAG: hypothetical protein HY289_06505, partial [Planctomycetes bacterium]|nr:hypothetical protein [Planctomycetota bacterium]
MSTAEQPADVLPTPIAPPLHMRYAVWWLLFLAGGIAASLLHDALWDDFVIAGYLGAGVMAVAIARWRAHRDSNGLAAWTFAVGRGLLLGVLLLGHGMLTWASADAVGRGEAGEPALWVIRIVLALFFGAVVL